MKMEFVGQTAKDATNPTGNPCRLINGYREPMIPGGRAGAVLRSVPGMSEFATLPSVFMRAMSVWNGQILAICGNSLFSVTSAGVVTLIGSVGAADSICGLDQSFSIAVLVANRQYQTWNGTVLALVATGAVTLPASLAYIGGYVIVSQYNARQFAWSALADPATWSGLDFASAEITDEPIIRIVAFKDALYIFKASGYERWAVTGLSGPDAFQRIDGAQGEPGLLDYGLVTTFPNGLAYIGGDGRAHVFGQGPISTPPLEVAIANSGPLALFFYEQRGHGFLCIAFRDIPAWCYDVATGEWHERSQGDGPWQSRATVKFNGAWHIGTDAGKIAMLNATCADFGAPLVRRYISRTLDKAERFVIDKIEAFPRPANDTQGDGDDSEAKVSLAMSRDGTLWSAPKARPVGTVGNYAKRVTWRSLGQFRSATAELSLSSVTDIPLLAEIDIEVS